MTRQKDWQHEGVKVANNIDEAMHMADVQAYIDGVDEVMMIGGAQLYEAALPVANRIYLTRVDATIEGDAFFPELDDQQWYEVSRQSFSASGANPYDYAFCVLERR